MRQAHEFMSIGQRKISNMVSAVTRIALHALLLPVEYLSYIALSKYQHRNSKKHYLRSYNASHGSVSRVSVDISYFRLVFYG